MTEANANASTAASSLIAHLQAEHKYGLGGLCASLLGRAVRDRLWCEAWCRQHLHRIAHRFLRLEPERCDALVPLLDHAAHVEPDAFVALLPPGEHERAALLLGLLVLTVASEDAELTGYDARARQLLEDVAQAAAVPWSRLAAMERDLAKSMRSQATAHATAGSSSSAGKKIATPPPPERRSTPPSSMGGDGDSGGGGTPSSDNGGSKGLRLPSVSAKWRKRLAVASIGVASGVAIGLTAGLAAPAVLAGLGSVGTGLIGMGGVGAGVGGALTATATMLTGTVGVTVVTTVFGATGAGLASYKMDRRLGDVKEFEFEQPPSSLLVANADADADDDEAPPTNDGLVVCVCVSGWLVDDDDSPTYHWWGGMPKAGTDNAETAPAASAPAASAPAASAPATAPPVRDYYWPNPPPPATANATGGAPSTQTLTAPQWERAAWLVEMGFPVGASREAAARFESMELMVEHLLASGVTPSVDAADAATGGSTAAADPSATLHVDEAALAESAVNVSADAVAAMSLGSPAAPPLTPSSPSHVAADDSYPTDGYPTSSSGTAGTPTHAAVSPPSPGLHPLHGSFVEVAAPKRSVIECLPCAEHHVLLWESKQLIALGSALGRIAASEALSVAAAQTLKHTFLGALMSAVAMPAYLIKACDVLDNPWAVAFNRAQKAGTLLAQVLLERAHGGRPVILLGFGLGARVIYEACVHLAEALEGGDGRAAGVIQHIVLMGLPATCETAQWTHLRRVAAGRVINVRAPPPLRPPRRSRAPPRAHVLLPACMQP